jgi:hypothetical protein
MAKSKQKTKQENNNETHSTFGRTISYRVSDEVATAAFKQAVGEPQEGTNSIADKFVTIMAFCTANLEAFTISDVLNYSKAFDLDLAEVKRLFVIWRDKNLALRRIEVTLGCYSDEIIIPV